MQSWIVEYVLSRLAESSTWRGIVLSLAGAAGWNLSDTKVTAIVSFGVALAGLLGAVLPDKLKK